MLRISATPAAVREVLLDLAHEIDGLNDPIRRIDLRLVKHCREDETARRLATIPGIGPITACALQAMVTAPQAFRSSRHFAAWIGLTPRSESSGGKERLGPISNQGNAMLRSFLVLGAIARLRNVRSTAGRDGWMSALLARRPRWQLWQLPTNLPGSHGPSWSEEAPTGQPPCPDPKNAFRRNRHRRRPRCITLMNAKNR
jgi:transposase